METKPKAEVAAKIAPKVKGPKTERFEFSGGGKYNAVALPIVPHEVVKVTDAGKGKLDFRLLGQQVIASRPFVPPVVVEYITTEEQARWNKAEIDAKAREAAK